jgi:hypothetical protein
MIVEKRYNFFVLISDRRLLPRKISYGMNRLHKDRSVLINSDTYLVIC